MTEEEAKQLGHEIMINYTDSSYKGLKILTPLTGKIRLGKGLIKELYIHMGYQKVSAYTVLLEFTFDRGNLVFTQDISLSNAQRWGAFRKRFKTGDLRQGIEDSFSLDIETE